MIRYLLVSVLSCVLFFGTVSAEEFSPMIQERIVAAKQGNAKAQYFIGTLFYNGYQVKRDYVTAYGFLLLAAKQGHTDAQNKLGEILVEGQSIHADNLTEDDVQAIKWFRLAATHGHALAAYNLGAMYENGKGVERNCTEAMKWYKVAFNKEQNENLKRIYQFCYLKLENMGY